MPLGPDQNHFYPCITVLAYTPKCCRPPAMDPPLPCAVRGPRCTLRRRRVRAATTQAPSCKLGGAHEHGARHYSRPSRSHKALRALDGFGDHPSFEPQANEPTTAHGACVRPAHTRGGPEGRGGSSESPWPDRKRGRARGGARPHPHRLSGASELCRVVGAALPRSGVGGGKRCGGRGRSAMTSLSMWLRQSPHTIPHIEVGMCRGGASAKASEIVCTIARVRERERQRERESRGGEGRRARGARDPAAHFTRGRARASRSWGRRARGPCTRRG